MDQEMLRKIISKVVQRVMAEALTEYLNEQAMVMQTQNELTRSGKSNAELEPEKLVTEEIVRRAWKEKAVLIINKGVICTPLAGDTMKELGVQVIRR